VQHANHSATEPPVSRLAGRKRGRSVVDPRSRAVFQSCNEYAVTYAAGAQLLEDGVEAAVQNGRVADSDCRRPPDELHRVHQRVQRSVSVVVGTSVHCNTRGHHPLSRHQSYKHFSLLGYMQSLKQRAWRHGRAWKIKIRAWKNQDPCFNFYKHLCCFT